METQSAPAKEQVISLPEIKPSSSVTTPKPTTKPAASVVDSRSVESSPSSIVIPSCSRWFLWDKVHESERRFLPEFFNERSPSKNARVYMYYRNSIIKMFRENPSRKITFTQVRKVLIGDVGAIRRVFDFLDSWGLINYTGMNPKPPKGDDKENKLSGDFKGNLYETSSSKKESSTRFCSGCKTVCSIACFVSDQSDLTFCARCYVRTQREGAVSTDFRRVEIREQTKTEWTDKETLQLLEATLHYGDDWKKVAEHVAGRSEKECVARFIKLPFKDQFIGHPDTSEVDKYYQTNTPDAENGDDFSPSSPAKKRRLTPFADTSNPIMAQVAFLSAMVGSGVAEAAARAAVEALSASNLATDGRCMERSDTSLPDEKDQSDSSSAANESDNLNRLVEAVNQAQTDIEKEEQGLEKSITSVVEVQMKELEDKIVHFEEVEQQMEKERKQLNYMKNLLFTDQLTLLFQRTTPSAMGESIVGAERSDSIR